MSLASAVRPGLRRAATAFARGAALAGCDHTRHGVEGSLAEACIAFVATAEGQVAEATFAPRFNGCAQRPDPTLVAAPLAGSRWTIFGAAIRERPEDVAPAPDCPGEGAVGRAAPVRLMSAVALGRVGGRGRVVVRRA